MSDAAVMTTAIVAMLYFKGNFSLASRYLFEQSYFPKMLSASRFNRRLHRIAELFLTLFLRLGGTWKKLNENSVYVIDSYPIAVCDNYRIKRSNIYQKQMKLKPIKLAPSVINTFFMPLRIIDCKKTIDQSAILQLTNWK